MRTVSERAAQTEDGAVVKELGHGRGPDASRLHSVLAWREAYFVPLMLVALVVVLSHLSDVFFTPRNLGQILIQAVVLGIAAVGVTFVIVAGDLDLSIGSTVALSGVVAAYGMTSVTSSVLVGTLLGLLTGICVGIVNGLLTAYLNVPAFISTLGVGVVATGLALYVTSGLTVAGLPPAFQALATTRILGLESMVWLMLLTFAVGAVVLHRTVFGSAVFATGGNREAAYMVGIPVARVRFANFVIAGACGGLGGVLLTSRILASQPGAGTTLTLFATAAVILGGTSIIGGSGSMLRSAFGVLLIAVVQNGLAVLGVDYALQQVAVGLVFILAACSEVLRRR
jgi:ribose transport system permease protein